MTTITLDDALQARIRAVAAPEEPPETAESVIGRSSSCSACSTARRHCSQTTMMPPNPDARRAA